MMLNSDKYNLFNYNYCIGIFNVYFEIADLSEIQKIILHFQ